MKLNHHVLMRSKKISQKVSAYPFEGEVIFIPEWMRAINFLSVVFMCFSICWQTIDVHFHIAAFSLLRGCQEITRNNLIK